MPEVEESLRRPGWLAWLVPVVVGGAAVSAPFAPSVGVGVLGLAGLGLGLAWNPRAVLYLTVGFTFLQDAVLHLPPPISSFDLLDELLIVALTGVWVAGLVLQRIPRVELPFLVPLLGFLVLGAVSWLVNHTAPLAAAVLSPRDYVFHLLLVYALLRFDWPNGCADRMIVVLYVTLAAHLVILTGQFSWQFAITGSLYLEDLATGLMGPNGAHKLGYFCGIVGLVALAGVRSGRERRALHGIVLAASCYGLILSSARAAYFAVPLAAIFGMVWGMTIRRVVQRLLITVALVGVGVVGGQWVIRHLPGFESATFDPIRLAQQQLRLDQGGAGRIGFMLFSIQLTEGSPSPALGRGPASYVSKTGQRFGGAMLGELARAFPVSVGTYPSIGVTLVEYGWLGLTLLGVLVWQMLGVARRTVRLDSEDLGWIGEGTAGAVFLFLLACLFENALEIQQLTGAIAVLVGTCLLVLREQKARGTSTDISD